MLPIYGTQPLRRFPWITLLLILANGLIFVGWQLRIGLDQSVDIAGLVPAGFATNPDTSIHLIASMFLHGGWIHLLGNLWFLWIFGSNIEGATGPRRFLFFYLLCGVAAGFTQIISSPHSTIPMVGASGAISGILGAYLLLFPRARIATAFFIFIFELPAFLFLFLWIGVQILSQNALSHAQQNQGGVAYMAHIGGFVTGLLLIKFAAARR